ncbi:hypothetical protein EYF80_027392 [Liparis tanakae]|uniref:Uncharacterized protein n=1 Tax=Liparis tanakae TaxID=230148 RepID=A0A4Z2H9U6_9TELE|nr:hypothetical protein EYF80_027392 [Liparis tanakae]
MELGDTSLVTSTLLSTRREKVKPGFGQLECDSRRERGRENEVVRERPREREKERGGGGKRDRSRDMECPPTQPTAA